MNTLLISGVVSAIRMGNKVSSFRLAVHRGKRAKDEEKTFFITVKVFGSSPTLTLEKGTYVGVCGRIDGHKYREKDIVEILCDWNHVFNMAPPQKKNDHFLPPGYPLAPTGSYDAPEVPYDFS